MYHSLLKISLNKKNLKKAKCILKPWYGMKELENAKFYYSKLNENKNCSFYLEEPGLLISSSYSWIGASLDGIRKCQCCEPTVVEIKCPFKGKDL